MTVGSSKNVKKRTLRPLDNFFLFFLKKAFIRRARAVRCSWASMCPCRMLETQAQNDPWVWQAVPHRWSCLSRARGSRLVGWPCWARFTPLGRWLQVSKVLPLSSFWLWKSCYFRKQYNRKCCKHNYLGESHACISFQYKQVYHTQYKQLYCNKKSKGHHEENRKVRI